MLIRLRAPDERFDKFIFLDGDNEIQIKYNDTLYIFWQREILTNFLKSIATHSRLTEIYKHEEKLLRGNVALKDWKLDLPTLSDPYLNQFKLALIGIDLELSTQKGHLELKYQHQTHPNWWLIHNVHICNDKKPLSKTEHDYLKFLQNRHGRFLREMQKHLPLLAKVDLGNFRTYDFSIAHRSNPFYYRGYILGSAHLSHKVYTTAIAHRQEIFTEFLDQVDYFTPVGTEDYYFPTDPSEHVTIEDLQLYRTGLPRGNYAFLSLHSFSAFFAASEYKYSMPYYDDAIGVRFTIATLVQNSVFAYANLSKLDLRHSCFVNTDFTGANLRDAQINIELMDETTLRTLLSAELDDKVKEQIKHHLHDLVEFRKTEGIEHSGTIPYSFAVEPVILTTSTSALADASSYHRRRAAEDARMKLFIQYGLFNANRPANSKEGRLSLDDESDDEEVDLIQAFLSRMKFGF